MQDRRVAAVFPGQGAYYGGALAAASETYPQIRSTFAEIDAVASERLQLTVSPVIFGADPPEIGQLLACAPEALQLAIYGISVACYRVLEAHGLAPAVLIGHSFGEIAALVCAGAFSVRDGAEIVCQRILALRRIADGSGYMAALGMAPARAQQVVELIGDQDTVVAVENHDAQTVVCGPARHMETVEQLAAVLGVPFVRLSSPYPFHSPLLKPVVEDFRGRLQHLRQAPLRTPVFSPITGRYYADDDVLTERLAEHLVRRVKFAAAVQQAYRDGAHVFVECGALDTLGKIVGKVLAAESPAILACLDPRLGDRRSLAGAVEGLREQGLIGGAPPPALIEALLPGVDPAAAGAFWAARAQRLLEHARTEFAAFTQDGSLAAGSASAAFDAAPGPAAPTPVAPLPRQGVAEGDKPTAGEAAVAPAPAAPAAPAAGGSAPTRDALLADLVAMYAEALEYPVEVFQEDVELEAELGVDSVKQTELMARVMERYQLPPPPPDFRLSDYRTMGNIADLLCAHLQAQGSGPLTVSPAPSAPTGSPVLNGFPVMVAR
jgi:malonyl CoA-acyl carrier protein transacylase